MALLSTEERIQVLRGLRRQCIELQDELNPVPLSPVTTLTKTTTAVNELAGVVKELIFQIERLSEK